MASTLTARVPKRGEQYYSLNRDSNETARLNLQHRLLTQNFRFLIHPSIPFSKPDLRIAEFATGTAIWLTEVSKLVPSGCKLDGYDISSAQFPPPELLPSTINLQQHDVLKPLGEKYLGYYDIIAVRLLVTALADDEWEKAVRNLIQYLKPGGYLQWVDADLSSHGIKVMQPSAMAPRAALQYGIDTVQKWAGHLGRHLNSCNRLGSIFHSQGLIDVHDEMMSTDWNADKKTRKDLSVEVTSAFQFLFMKYAGMDGSEMTMEQGLEIGEKMLREAELGEAYLRLDFNIVTGRKPSLQEDLKRKSA